MKAQQRAMEKLGEAKSDKIVKDIYRLASENPVAKSKYSSQLISSLQNQGLPIHPKFLMERVDKFRDGKGTAVIHVAIECALDQNDTTMLEQMFSLNLQMYEADNRGITCLKSCFDEAVSIEATIKVVDIMIKAQGFDITKSCVEANGRQGKSLLQDLFWKLSELGDSSEANKDQYWNKVSILLSVVANGTVK